MDVLAMEPYTTIVIEGGITMPIRDRLFPVPDCYDKWLRDVYGDYRKLPPVDQRKPQHISEIIEESGV